MKIPVETKPALWGAAGGAVALAIVGFSWGGWMTGSKAEAAATMRADTAVVAALAPGCAARFRRDAAFGSHMAELKKTDSWSQGDYIEKGGWAAGDDGKATANASAVAKACAESLTKE